MISQIFVAQGASKKYIRKFLTLVSEYNLDDMAQYFYDYPDELEGGNIWATLFGDLRIRYLLTLFFGLIFLLGPIRIISIMGCLREGPTLGPVLERRLERSLSLETGRVGIAEVSYVRFQSQSISQWALSFLTFSSEYLPQTRESELEEKERYENLLKDALLKGVSAEDIKSIEDYYASRRRLPPDHYMCYFNNLLTSQILTCLRPRSMIETQACKKAAIDYISVVLELSRGKETKDLFVKYVLENDVLFSSYGISGMSAIGFVLGAQFVYANTCKKSPTPSWLFSILRFTPFTVFFVAEFFVDFLDRNLNYRLLQSHEVPNPPSGRAATLLQPTAPLCLSVPYVGSSQEGGQGGSGRRRASSRGPQRPPSGGGRSLEEQYREQLELLKKSYGE